MTKMLRQLPGLPERANLRPGYGRVGTSPGTAVPHAIHEAKWLSHPADIIQLMTIDSVIAEAFAWSSTPLGIGVTTGVILTVVRILPQLAVGLIRGMRAAPERMLMGTLNLIDRKARSKSDFLL